MVMMAKNKLVTNKLKVKDSPVFNAINIAFLYQTVSQQGIFIFLIEFYLL